MTSKERFITALEGGTPDRLPVTTHHVMPSFLKNRLDGISNEEFFECFELDPIRWISAQKPNEARGEFFDPVHTPGYLEARRVTSDSWRIEEKSIPDQQYETTRYHIISPVKTLSMVLQSDEHTAWVAERLVKEKTDIEIIAAYAPMPLCDVDEVNRQAEEWGERGLLRGFVPGFEIYGQPGCWQDAAVLFGIEELIIATFEDPQWVHQFLSILHERKRTFIRSMSEAKYDIIELGGGDASCTVISPQILNDFVIPYDAPLIECAHEAGQRIVYHTCGGMMPILEDLASMGMDAMETFTPEGMGGDVLLREAKERIGDRVCMIGGFDQFHFFVGCTPETTRAEVRRCFAEAGAGGGYILSPSDHFFDAEPELLHAFSDEARACVYL